ncbi:hypothetical protein RJ639_021051 [Escallonia herrerae]|uniref:MEKHLA domain-containing protein n=1 Tax=Escallonia herrerae TaxID=1293975 RepID=A0AA88V5U8_9ASTE|nr:hypothetical protein RJ639_021051 [Escallonia herrerae]
MPAVQNFVRSDMLPGGSGYRPCEEAQEVSQSNATNCDRKPAALRALSRRLSRLVYSTYLRTSHCFASFHLWEPVFTFGNQAGLDMLETTLVALQDTAWQNL